MGNTMDETERDFISAFSFSTSKSTSKLPAHALRVIQDGARSGFKDGILNLSHNDIDDSMISEICEWLFKLGDKVKQLLLDWNRISSKGASQLFNALKEYRSICSNISLEFNQLNAECMKSLGEFIQNNPYLERLILGVNSINDKGIGILAEYLVGNTALKFLDISRNIGITDASIPVITKMIESSHMIDITIFNTSISNENILIVPIANNKNKCGCARLSLAQSNLSDDDLIKICEGMKKHGINNLKRIEFIDNMITSKGASVLFKTLIDCNSIATHLDLSNNQLDDACMAQLGEFIEFNNHLQELNIGKNLTDKGIEILSEFLLGNTTLKEIYLGNNEGITDASVPFLVDAIKKSNIIKLNVWKTSISEEKKREIAEPLTIPTDQREIAIKSNTKSASKTT